MRAILLAAGYGKRLAPLTTHTPKCLMPIKGEPLLKIWLDNLSRASIEKVLINTHYLSQKVQDYIDNSYCGSVFVKTIHEKILLGTAGTLIKNLDFYGGQDGLLIHADNYCCEDIELLINAHNNRPQECLITMLTFETADPSSCGIIKLDDKNCVISFHEKSKVDNGNLANGAIYVLSKEFLSKLSKDYSNVSDFSLDILPTLMGKIYSYKTKKTMIDIGTVENYIKANKVD